MSRLLLSVSGRNVGVTDYRTIATRLLIAFVIPLALTGCVSGEDEKQEVKKIAEKVKRQAELSEKAEGSQDLVKDKVTVRKGEKGQPIIEQIGEASSYGQGFHGKKTSTGEKFDQNDRTAAHPTLPMGTQTTVTNLKTGNSVDVTINDRGPYVKGRDIDLSKRAAKDLGITKEGVAAVKIEAEIAPADKSKEKK